ncbi:hypothetical protein ACCO45_013068, partial [Purpureocillium lilacinum]
GARAHSGQQIPYEHSQVARTASYLRAGNPRSQSPFTDRRRYCTCLAPPVQRTIGTRSVTTAVLPSLPLPLPPANHHRHSQPLASRPGPFLLPFSPGRHETALGYAALKVLEVLHPQPSGCILAEALATAPRTLQPYKRRRLNHGAILALPKRRT